MSPMSQSDRAWLAETLGMLETEIAEIVTDEFFHRHPDWLARYGERGRERGREDARFHLRFLAGSVLAGEPGLFRDYAHWTARVLLKRGITSEFVVENLEQVRTALSDRLSASEQLDLLPYFEAGMAGAVAPQVDADHWQGEGPLALTCSLFTQAILNGERASAATIVKEALDDGASAVDIYVEVLQNALYRVGCLWETNEITVAQEHMATAITQFVVATLYPHLERTTARRGTIVLTGIEGELHQVGAMMLGDVLEADGWEGRFLGTNMPQEGIVKTVADHHADILGISTTMLFNVPKAAALIEACRAATKNNGLRIIVGGGAFRGAPALHEEIGADAYAPDLRSARDLVRGWARPAATRRN